MSKKLKRRKQEDTTDSIAKDVESTILEPMDFGPPMKTRGLFSTGSTLLNLALAESIEGGFCEGTCVNIIGDEAAGKSFLTFSTLVEALYDSKRSEYLLEYDEPEVSFQFDIDKLFGEKSRLISRGKHSLFIQDWYDNIFNKTIKVKDPRPFIYAIDSYDSMDDVHEADMEPEEIGQKGGYRTGKAIASSQIFRKIVGGIADTNSLLIVVSQTRSNLGFGSMFKPKARFGGNALDFYSSHIMWMAVKRYIKKRERDIGVEVECRVSKNKRTGKRRVVEFPILYDYGIDDITSMVKFMVKEGFWCQPKAKGKDTSKIPESLVIETEDPFVDATLPKLIDHIEENDLIDDLKKIVAECWMKIEEEIRPVRKPKYG